MIHPSIIGIEQGALLQQEVVFIGNLILCGYELVIWFIQEVSD